MFDRLYPGMQWTDYRHEWPNAHWSQFVHAGGIKWHVQMAGQGPALLLLHGTGSGNFSWRDLLPVLTPHFTLIAPDLPGHAFTTRGSDQSLSLKGMSSGVLALLQQLGITPAAIVGHSAGAAIAAQMVVQEPRLADTHLMGLNPAWLPLPGVPAWIFGPAAKLAALNPLSAWATVRFAKRPGVIAKSVAQTGSHLSPAGIALYQAVFTHTGHVHSVLGMMASWKLAGLTDALAALKNPVTMLVGTNDKTIPPSLAHDACRVMPQATLHQQIGLGHLAHEEQPVDTARHLCAAYGINRSN